MISLQKLDKLAVEGAEARWLFHSRAVVQYELARQDGSCLHWNFPRTPPAKKMLHARVEVTVKDMLLSFVFSQICQNM